MEKLVFKFFVISKNNSILLTYDNNRWTLPTYDAKPSHVAETAQINHFFKSKYKLMTNVLRCYNETDRMRIYEIELLDKEWFSPNMCWINRLNLEDVNELCKEDKLLLNDWNASFQPTNLPWFSHGWVDEIKQWFRKELSCSTFELKQIRSWERSALFRVKLANNNYYFKAVPPIFSHEPILSQYLYQHHPSCVPSIHSVDSKRRWYIMQELTGPLLGKTNNMHHWQGALLKLAEIQKKSIENINKIKHMCPIRPISKVIQTYMRPSLNTLYNSNNISNEIYNQFIESIPAIINICDLLEQSHIPHAIDHGDFFGGNIIVHGNIPIIYDWSDCTLSHPFLSITTFLEEVEHFFSKEHATYLLDLYLAEWRSYNSPEQLYNEYELIKLIAPVFYLTVYQTFIFPSFHDNWDKQHIIDGYINKWLALFAQ
ncbi:phosphotransferase [Cytobacillus sp. Hm23]